MVFYCIVCGICSYVCVIAFSSCLGAAVPKRRIKANLTTRTSALSLHGSSLNIHNNGYDLALKAFPVQYSNIFK